MPRGLARLERSTALLERTREAFLAHALTLTKGCVSLTLSLTLTKECATLA